MIAIGMGMFPSMDSGNKICFIESNLPSQRYQKATFVLSWDSPGFHSSCCVCNSKYVHKLVEWD